MCFVIVEDGVVVVEGVVFVVLVVEVYGGVFEEK